MKYMKMKAQSDGSFKATYVLCADSLLSDADIYDTVQQLVVRDITSLDEITEEDTSFDLDDDELTQEDFLYYMSDPEHVRLTFNACVLGNPTDTALSVYRVSSENVGDNPQFWAFAAICGQDQDVDSFGYTDNEHPQEKVFEDARQDVMYQLKRYTKASGFDIKSGLFTATEISQEGYETEIDDRELVLA